MAEKTINLKPPRRPLHPRRCETCRHFEPDTGPNNGLCVANYPVAIPAPAQHGMVGVLVFFPTMRPDQRCSKWEDVLPPSETDVVTEQNEIPY